ncbi:hypothetical protein IV500_05370 [Paeniglutamicibacter antarcticus]|uniref:Camelysin metallo-endopeptidase n=1 Tax=Arthrobacter terrae TaxID=2935737 RepID=A0A931G4W2_9MICC|nr:TasA family protein [Arthrobacter terrae]MBG0738850.1 hypothetical protein [Arthrobacter terrae]
MGISLKTTTGKILASAALLGTAAAVAGLGTYGAFTSSTTASAAVNAGTMNIALGGAGGVNNLSVAAEGLLPGDKMERLVTLANTGSSDLGSIVLSTTTASTTALTSDLSKGLQLTVQGCSVPWVGAAAPYTCPGSVSTVLAATPVIGVNTLSSLASLSQGKSDNLKVSAALPNTADNAFQGLKSAIGFQFDSTQRTAAIK